MEEEWGHMDASFDGRIRTDYRHMLVQKDAIITDGLPTRFGNYAVEYLETAAVTDRCNRLKRPFAILRIGPVQNEGAQLKVVASVYWASVEKRRLHLALSDWSSVEFRYDCDQQRFVVTAVKLGGS
jgi:hypothetical protein